jgi:ATP-dependent helicase/nuclease subunit B
VRKKIGELADRMIEGVIEVKPYRVGKETPCSNCEYRSVCRFDAAINSYLMLAPMKRSEVLAKVVEGAR